MHIMFQNIELLCVVLNHLSLNINSIIPGKWSPQSPDLFSMEGKDIGKPNTMYVSIVYIS